MRYAKIEKGAVAKYPYSFRDWRNDNPNVSPPKNPSDEWLAGVGVARIVETKQPAPSDPITKNVIDGTPVLIGETWTQAWVEEDATAEQIASRQARAADLARKAEVKADAFIQNFLTRTPTQVANFFDNNFPSLTAAERTTLGKMGLLLLILARREFDDE